MADNSPEATVARMLGTARIVKTPCAGGDVVWQCWPTPSAGSGETPLLLLHGGFGSWTHWIANIAELSKGRPVITADLPGLGDSADAPEPLSPDGIAAVLYDGLDTALGKGQEFDLVGFSFGGLIGARLAAMAGDRCRAYVAVGASGFQGLHVRVLGILVPDPGLADVEIDAIHREN
ncbi:MAG: alpha/beta fold hydrolase, partial [Proteobacteria bacterium]|nr:alpha/beta fold hydrolase [Pseudomonadota bacterium]